MIFGNNDLAIGAYEEYVSQNTSYYVMFFCFYSLNFVYFLLILEFQLLHNMSILSVLNILGQRTFNSSKYLAKAATGR